MTPKTVIDACPSLSTSGLSSRSMAPLACMFAFSAVLSGCASVQPAPITPQHVAAVSADAMSQLKTAVEPLAGPLSMEEAIARAIKYNLNRQVKIFEEAVSQGHLDVDRYDMLPKLVASAGYHDRSNDLISRSTDSVTGQPSLANPYISSDRGASTSDLSFTWSLLDFGQSYYAAKQNADRTQIASERRRKALHL